MKNKIYNLVIVDESGSMGCLREATLSGINETIGTIRSAQNEFADTQEHFLTLVSFNAIANHADVRTLINCRPIGEIGEDFSDYHPLDAHRSMMQWVCRSSACMRRSRTIKKLLSS